MYQIHGILDMPKLTIFVVDQHEINRVIAIGGWLHQAAQYVCE
jgi:hypothetical protein